LFSNLGLFGAAWVDNQLSPMVYFTEMFVVKIQHFTYCSPGFFAKLQYRALAEKQTRAKKDREKATWKYLFSLPTNTY